MEENRFRRFLTNTNASKREILLQAAKTTGFVIELTDTAIDSFGNSLGEGFIALYVCGPQCDTAPFWKELERLEQLKS